MRIMAWKDEICELVLVVRGFVTMVNLLGVSAFMAAASEWDVSTGKVQSPTFFGENPRSNLS
jgi:hypothetical protein